MTQKELATLIQETLAEMLTEKKVFRNAEFDDKIKYYVKDELFTIIEEEYYNVFSESMMTRSFYEGKLVSTEPVYRHNGTNEDMSMDVEIEEWWYEWYKGHRFNNSGKRIAKIRLSPKQKPETTVKKVRKFIEENYK